MQSSLSLRKASWPPILINRLHFLPDYTRLGTFFGGKGLFYRPVHAVVVVCWLFVFCLFVCFLIFFLSVCLFVCLLLFLKKCNGSMTQNKLKLDQEKTQALLIDPQNSPNLPLSIKIGQNDFFFFLAKISLVLSTVHPAGPCQHYTRQVPANITTGRSLSTLHPSGPCQHYTRQAMSTLHPSCPGQHYTRQVPVNITPVRSLSTLHPAGPCQHYTRQVPVNITPGRFLSTLHPAGPCQHYARQVPVNITPGRSLSTLHPSGPVNITPGRSLSTLHPSQT